MADFLFLLADFNFELNHIPTRYAHSLKNQNLFTLDSCNHLITSKAILWATVYLSLLEFSLE